MTNVDISSIQISAISHATEDDDKVLEAMIFFLPEDVEKDAVYIETVENEGCFGNPIKLHTITINKNRECKKVYTFLHSLFLFIVIVWSFIGFPKHPSFSTVSIYTASFSTSSGKKKIIASNTLSSSSVAWDMADI